MTLIFAATRDTRVLTVSCRQIVKNYLSDFQFRPVSPTGPNKMNTMFIKKTPQPLPGPFFAVMRLDPQEKNVIHQCAGSTRKLL
jgi:hypothetical protein